MPKPSKAILCVDDHSDTCSLITVILNGYEVVAAYSMADAISRATARKFDLYVLDYHLPDGTGLELCLMLRTFDRDTPIIFATGTSSITLKQVTTAGSQGLLNKSSLSFSDELRSHVDRLLN